MKRIPKMPHKDPENLIEFITNSAAFQGFIVAMIIAALRTIYFGERKIIQIGMETLLCGFLSLGAAGLIDLVEALFLKEQLPQTVLITVCGMVGFIGVTTLSEFLKKFLNNNAGRKPRNRYDRYNDDDEDTL
ncbi:hypothetical protein DM558_00545 [Entomomonas moraniae]|uniref:Phage holin, lambda family n=2 Tax=Entomomonas moraniae TaxID=2213226 RepID=A0A3Q9JH37_9GAMM|nr:hypothetical protein DM558_00545 [Entomomonas moraniae]